MNARRFVLGAALATGALLAGCATPAPATRAMPVVLVHGAWMGASSWDRVAAYLPQNGQSLYQLSAGDADSQVGKYWTQADPKANSPATIRAEGIAEVFCADCSAADQQDLVATHRAEAVPPLGTPVVQSSARFGGVPRIYVHTLKDRAVSYRLQQRMLAAAGGAARVVTLDTSHLPMLTRPQAVADVIADAAR